MQTKISKNISKIVYVVNKRPHARNQKNIVLYLCKLKSGVHSSDLIHPHCKTSVIW